ncbi:hypothetical protein F5879DRAFT_616076 [Lentinula edodes]|uniref:uncharacterized protein n=1 Tax=Lentinula edodes TaxID=5353 RepID=UPI001BF8CFDF|nr:uncharacterized protein C8R40DRAFT_745704 [Lentinula edodes]KAF8823190.1 hypothetical protein HHX47_DHR10000217 [Lentinula edodes]KAH7869321.1 hypothetical protein C8R40DRAFT_745704 [Lentinula edodes]KAJ3898416.1 hypothetical protein F5879DRAFT_616076 [Lentinula edodes]
MRASTVLFPSISLAVFLAITSLILPAAAILIPFKKSPKLPDIPSLSSGIFQILAYKDEQCSTRKSPLITVQHHFSEAQVYEVEYPTPKAKCALVQALPANCVLILYGKEDNNERFIPDRIFPGPIGPGKILNEHPFDSMGISCKTS